MFNSNEKLKSIVLFIAFLASLMANVFYLISLLPKNNDELIASSKITDVTLSPKSIKAITDANKLLACKNHKGQNSPTIIVNGKTLDEEQVTQLCRNVPDKLFLDMFYKFNMSEIRIENTGSTVIKNAFLMNGSAIRGEAQITRDRYPISFSDIEITGNKIKLGDFRQGEIAYLRIWSDSVVSHSFFHNKS